MALDKLVDSTQLDSDLTSVANAIRTKGGTSAQLAFPAGFVSAIEAISGGTVYYAPNSGVPYVKDTVYTVTVGTNNILAWQISNLVVSYGRFAGATHLESFELHTPTGTPFAMDNARAQQIFYNCTALKRVVYDAPITNINGANQFYNCSALESVIFGGVGKPVTGTVNNNVFHSACTALTSVVVYVNAATLVDIPSTITSNAPFGAANATITYKNSTTGEVISA